MSSKHTFQEGVAKKFHLLWMVFQAMETSDFVFSCVSVGWGLVSQPHTGRMIFVSDVLWEAGTSPLWTVEMNLGGSNGVESCT